MPNRLADSSSPYLRMHADDPVDWFAWGPDAFEEAARRDCPIFLSVGYASCHWCHVMHRESFQDPVVAEFLNHHFVCIKVDREERPDVDELYMGYVAAATGGGGWPMTVALTPDLAPFFGGTYFPPEPRFGIASFSEVLGEVVSAFESDRDGVEGTAESGLGYLRVMFAAPTPGTITARLVDAATDAILSTVDSEHGGFAEAPKFPQHTVDGFLLSYHARTREPRPLQAVESELRAIVRGGIYDQLGGGIARYSVDDAWLVPHFEKMLYDNALLLSTLARAHQAAPSPEWERAIRETAAFLERDLAAPQLPGAFASSRSADTAGVEGATYTWTWQELRDLLSAEELDTARRYLGVTPEGNWEGTNILSRPQWEQEVTDASTRAAVHALVGKLFEHRGHREQPDLDDKVITSWNALAARGLMDAGAALHDDALTRRGVALLRTLLAASRIEGAPPRHVVGVSQGDAAPQLEDPIALAWASTAAFDASRDRAWLNESRSLFDRARQDFCQDGAWSMVPAGTELPVRPRERHDGPTPTGAHLAALVAVALAERLRDPEYLAVARRTLERAVPLAQRAPLAAGTALEAMLELLSNE